MRIIVLATVPHTGTWFMVEFLRTHPEVTNFVEIQVLQKAGNLPADSKAGRRGLVSDRVNLVQGHFGPLPHQKLLLAFAALCPLIIPLRDPLLALITAHHRGQDVLQAGKIWRELATQIDAERDFYQPLYVPLDLLPIGKFKLPGDFQLSAMRLEKLVQALYVANLSDTDSSEWASFKHAQKWAEEWLHDKYNSRGMYPLKEAYLAGDKKKIRDAMPEAYYFLEQSEDALRPMLEREGYRELMWWS